MAYRSVPHIQLRWPRHEFVHPDRQILGAFYCTSCATPLPLYVADGGQFPLAATVGRVLNTWTYCHLTICRS